MKAHILLVGLTLGSCVAPGEGDATPLQSIADSLATRGIRVRGSVARAHLLKDAPARFQLRDGTGDGNTETVVDVGISWEEQPDSNQNLEYGVNVEHHRNSLEEKEQDSFLGGALIRYYGGEQHIGRPLPATGRPPEYPAWIAQLELKAKHDGVAETNGFLAKATFTPILGSYSIPRVEGSERAVTIVADAGLLFEDADGGAIDGNVTRGFARADLAWYPLKDTWDDRFELIASGTYWGDLSQGGTFDGLDEHTRLVRVGASVYFDFEKRLGVILEHVNGGNPETGLPDQEYVLFTLAAKI